MPLIVKTPKMKDFLVSTTMGRYRPHPSSTLAYKGATFCVSNIGSCYCTDTHAMLYHLEKQRVKKSDHRGGHRYIVRQACWTMKVYAIPLSSIKRVTQHARHFTVELIPYTTTR